ncbi:deoxypodophyllotoxin synthase-like [Rosa rugosa]|uniref:deoxypodophyllotoxin synthase-like n=1 Tax=Rosa rugosa TaxID=74645 RepID=UPI002B413694|nr:deoxypodophyllotoxin synthase-like [Rosa rugosa]
MTQIPVVDFSDLECLKPGTSSWLSVRKQVCNALEDPLGYFTGILSSELTLELHNTVFGAFQAWTNDKIRAYKHRVNLIHSDQIRYSFGLFSLKKGVTTVPKEMVDKDHPLKYKPLNQVEYILLNSDKRGPWSTIVPILSQLNHMLDVGF